MTPEFFVVTALVPALSLLPDKMNSQDAKVMVLAICLHESGLVNRTQVGGPARGYAQFERSGVAGVLTHKASAMSATRVCGALDFPSEATQVYAAIAFNDILAAAFARLLLWTLPQPLPHEDPAEGWYQYLEAWKPGHPRPQDWNSWYAHAMNVITDEG